MARQSHKRKNDSMDNKNNSPPKLLRPEGRQVYPVDGQKLNTTSNEVVKDVGRNNENLLQNDDKCSPRNDELLQNHAQDGELSDRRSDNNNVDHALPTTLTGLFELLEKLRVKVKVQSKSAITTKSGGVGLYFNFEMTDGAKKIRGVVFGDPCNKFHELLKVDEYFLIEKFKLNSINPKYGEGYELIMTKDSIITELEDFEFEECEAVYDLVSVENIYNMTPGTFIDFLGTVMSFGPIQSYEKGTGIMKFRNIEFMDEKKYQILIVFWNDLAENCEQLFQIGDVLLLSQVRVNEFNQQKKLFYVSQSTLVKSSKNERFLRLKNQGKHLKNGGTIS